MNLHHIGLLVPDIAAASSNYVSLGYQTDTRVVHDPIQTAYVQFFHLPGDEAYLELISPDGSESKLANALRKGGGLHHLCYCTDDIDAACRGLESSGWFLVSPPVSAVAFQSRRIAWLRGGNRLLIELVERGPEGETWFARE